MVFRKRSEPASLSVRANGKLGCISIIGGHTAFKAAKREGVAEYQVHFDDGSTGMVPVKGIEYAAPGTVAKRRRDYEKRLQQISVVRCVP